MNLFLLSKVKESGIVDIILNYKKQMDYCHIISSYRSYDNKIDWDRLSEKEELDHDFLVFYKDNINWKYLSFNENIKMKIETYRMFADKFNWEFIYHPLDDDFLTEFQDKVHWSMVSVNIENPSFDFLYKWQDRLNWSILKHTNKIKKEHLLYFNHYFQLPKFHILTL